MSKVRKGSHTTSWLTVHLIFVTKYRYKVLVGALQSRCRDLIRQDCDAMEIRILKGVVSKDHVHLHIEYQLKGRSSTKLQSEYASLRKRYWGKRFWSRGFGAFSTGNITDEMVQKYIEGHRKNPNDIDDNYQ